MTRQTTVIEAVLFYPYLAAPCTTGKFPNNKYQVELGSLSDEAVARLESIGLGHRINQQATHDNQGNELDNAFDKGRFISVKSSNGSFTVFDGDVETVMPTERLTLLGNGSKVRAKVDSYIAKFDGSVCAGLNDIIVEEFVAYEGAEDETDPAVEEEFTGGKTRAVAPTASEGWDTESPSA